MEKMSNTKAYFSMWRRCFDYKGKSEKKEYWVPFCIHLVLIIIASICLVFSALEGEILLFPGLLGIIILAFLVISLLPWTALCVRIGRNYGGKIWWKFVLFFIGVGAVIFDILLLVGIINPSSAFVPGVNQTQCVYGPPLPIEQEYDPSNNIPEDVYGPPIEEWEPTSVDEDDEEDMTLVESNIPELVYGPPEAMNDQATEPVEESQDDEQE